MSQYTVLHLTYKQLQQAIRAGQTGAFIGLSELEALQETLVVTERPAKRNC